MALGKDRISVQILRSPKRACLFAWHLLFVFHILKRSRLRYAANRCYLCRTLTQEVFQVRLETLSVRKRTIE